jgi:hypothetical protein
MKMDRLTRPLSLILGLLSIAALIYIDKVIATRYIQADGKTKALFGIIEFSEFSYKYWILFPAVLSVMLTFRIFWTGKFKLLDIAVLFIGLISIVGTVTASWRLLT